MREKWIRFPTITLNNKNLLLLHFLHATKFVKKLAVKMSTQWYRAWFHLVNWMHCCFSAYSCRWSSCQNLQCWNADTDLRWGVSLVAYGYINILITCTWLFPWWQTCSRLNGNKHWLKNAIWRLSLWGKQMGRRRSLSCLFNGFLMGHF